ncbi:metallophosphoesterase family protein [Atopobiaceae bacterium HCP3S3_A4]
MLVLVIPDVHLKPRMFDAADRAIDSESPDAVVQLGDLPDDWGMQRHPEAYDALYERAETFLADHPETLWCFGNHDMSYFWDAPESGMAKGNVLRHVQERSRVFWDKVPQDRKAFVHRIDNVCFSHAGILQDFIEDEGLASASTDDALAAINQMGRDELWQEFSPLWARPQGMADLDILYRPQELFQVVGHTPVKYVREEGNLLSCDVFSTYSWGGPIGTEEFSLVDTKSWTFRTIKAGELR